MLVRLATEFRGCATSVAWIRGADAGESVFRLIAGVCYASSSSGIREAVFGVPGMRTQPGRDIEGCRALTQVKSMGLTMFGEVS